MAQESPAKVKVKSIDQVGIVVHDLQTVVENYWNILGIGPWDIYEWEAPLVYDYAFHGKPAWARAKIAITMVGGVMLEVLQHVDGDTVYRDFLTEHGEGLMHLMFLVDDSDETSEILVKEGFPSMQSGRFGDNNAFDCFDIKPLRAIWEPCHFTGDVGVKPSSRYPATEQESPAKVKVKSIDQVAIVVHDLQTVAQNYWNILGIGPWDIYEWEAPLVHDRKYHGKPSRAREKIAITMVGGVMLELVQPVEGDSIYQDYLMERGEGLHHMNFLVDDLDETSEILVKEGFPSIQSGRWGAIEDKNGFNYIDIKPLRAIWEPVHFSGRMGGEPLLVVPGRE